MTLLVAPDAWEERRLAVAGPLASLAESLAAELEPLLSRELYVPADKALLSREGGRCPRDGTMLEFNPFEPHVHRCPRCGEQYRGELHDRFWIYWYQLWLAERAVHGAALARLGYGERYGRLATAILDGYVERYTSYPNRDNVLGPTRLFFSTYLESIWLLQICVAVDLLTNESGLSGRVLDQIVAPSRAIIADYDEGASNRQVWNDAALLAAARMFGDSSGAEQAVYGPSGVASHLVGGILADGTWYEGENYHLFAHRGLWYGVTMAERAGLELPAPLLERFALGFAAPFKTALPDFTLPSRRDSQYAISLRQWRIAEHCELGIARGVDPVVLGALQRMYVDDVPRCDTGRSTSSADVERNAQPSALSRADLGWRALLCASPTLPSLTDHAPDSTLLEAQGIAVFRRDAGRCYVALDYGHSGGGHGHPDRLNLLLAVGSRRWLDDFGTGSYVDPSLHWYRSTLAHNAPLVNGRSQRRVDGMLMAYDEQGDAGWIEAIADDVAPGTSVARTIVVLPTYAIDLLEWEADQDVVVDLPLHVDADIVGGGEPSEAAPLAGGDGLEDGFASVRDTTRQHVAAHAVIHARATGGTDSLDLWASSSQPVEWWRGVAPGPPGHGDHVFQVVRSHGALGICRFVWSWSGDVTAVAFDDAIRVTLRDGTVHEHWRADDGWRIARESGAGRAVTRLGGRVNPDESASDELVAAYGLAPRDARIALRRTTEITIELGEAHYRRSEENWADAGRPTASVRMVCRNNMFEVRVHVPRSDLTFVPAGAVNLYDNEPADINGDSVQFYLQFHDSVAALMLVPVAESNAVRIRPLDGWTVPHDTVAVWERAGDGYELRIELPCASDPVAVDVVVNEMPRGRDRRRGQLVLSGGSGEFVYLRGDRHDPRRLIELDIADE